MPLRLGRSHEQPVESFAAPGPEPFEPALEAAVREGFLSTYLAAADPEWLASDAGRAEVRREIVDKYAQCARFVVPWVARVAPLEGRTMVEVGCGTGAKSAAFAPHVARVFACDLSEAHLAAAGHRVGAMGLDNVDLDTADADTFLGRLERELGPGSVGVCLLFAVLEHMTLDERLSALTRAWRLLAPGGVLVVLESPNRLLPWDWHSSRLPFFNMLPDDVAARYYRRSPRPDFVAAVAGAEAEGPEAVQLALTRQGRGISYHEFELALGDGFAHTIVADGWDAELLALNPRHADELRLVEFVAREGLAVPAAFTRYWVELVLRAPAGDARGVSSLPAPLGTRWEHGVLSRDGLTLPLGPGMREAVLVLEAPEPARVEVRDDRRGRARIQVAAGTSVHRLPVADGATSLRGVVTSGSVSVPLAFGR